MTQKPPKIESPAPRRLGVGSWWMNGFWFSHPVVDAVVVDTNRVCPAPGGWVVR